MVVTITRPASLFDNPDAPPVDGARMIDGEWHVDVPDLAALVALVDRHGSVTVMRPRHVGILYRLRIEG